MLYAKATTKKSPKELDTSRTASILKPAITATTESKRTMVAITADLKTKDLVQRLSHRCSALLS